MMADIEALLATHILKVEFDCILPIHAILSTQRGCLTWCCLQLLTNCTLPTVNVDAAMYTTAAKCSAVSCTLILICSTLIKKMTVLSYVARQN